MTPTPTCAEPRRGRPWYSRSARRGGVTLAAATAVVLFGVLGAAPSYAEELPAGGSTDSTSTTETTAPTDSTSTTEPSTPSTEPSTPSTEEPSTETPTPTPEPTPTPTPEPTPTPTPTPTPEPTPTPTPEPTPTPTPEPTPTPTPSPSATPTTSPTTTTTTRSTLRAGASSFGTNSLQSAALAAAQARIQFATSQLRAAETALADARSMRAEAQAVAERMQGLADDAQAKADSAGRVYFAAAQGDGATLSSIPAAFGAGKDLLAGLGGVARVEQIAGDVEKLLAIADKRTEEAAAAQERADAAWAAVDEVPVEAAEADVEAAEQDLADARQALADLQADAASESELASSGVSLLLNLPADAGQLSDQGWALPVVGRVTDGFGPRPVKPLPGVNDFHRGTDLAAACGTAVYAATGGVVNAAGPNGSLGNWIQIDHGSGVETGYGHLTQGGIFVAPGEAVTAGQHIGAVGSTGAST